jgi:hypothetical protein
MIDYDQMSIVNILSLSHVHLTPLKDEDEGPGFNPLPILIVYCSGLLGSIATIGGLAISITITGEESVRLMMGTLKKEERLVIRSRR